eukprot:7179729-Pyramimonas_sp.AAC.1
MHATTIVIPTNHQLVTAPLNRRWTVTTGSIAWLEVERACGGWYMLAAKVRAGGTEVVQTDIHRSLRSQHGYCEQGSLPPACQLITIGHTPMSGA